MPRRFPLFPSVPVLALGVVFLAGCGQKTETSTTTATDSTVSLTPPSSTPGPTSSTTITTDTTSGPSTTGTMPVRPATPPEHIEVQHILIGYQGSIPGKTVTRTKAEAEKLAQEVLAKARAGENMDALVQQYTDDQFPGVYDLANDGVTPDAARQEYKRSGMVKGFSDTAFGLSVGNVGISNHDAQTSPFGWHIIKRLK